MKPALLWLTPLCAVAVSGAAPTAAPGWLQQKIAGYERLAPFSPPRSIVRTRYAGKPAYYVSPACCDIPSELYDEAGNLLCRPDGGFAGGDGRCPSFTPELVTAPRELVWRDARAASKPSQ